MKKSCRNIYQCARNLAGLSQERAAELLGVSVRSLADYESGVRVPPNEIVDQMVAAYDSQLLWVQHLRNSSRPARQLLPDVQQMRLPEAVLALVDEIYEFADDKMDRELIDIARDGVISQDEVPRYDAILIRLQHIVAAAVAVSCAKDMEG
jgi:transcriptional regulator with XRE-family HTH domain